MAIPAQHLHTIILRLNQWLKWLNLPGMTGLPNSFTARGPVTLIAILFTQPAV